MDDNGLVEGKWEDAFEDGTSPFAWIGSTPIFEEFYNTQLPVKYGQCWVFSGVIVTSTYLPICTRISGVLNPNKIFRKIDFFFCFVNCILVTTVHSSGALPKNQTHIKNIQVFRSKIHNYCSSLYLKPHSSLRYPRT